MAVARKDGCHGRDEDPPPDGRPGAVTSNSDVPPVVRYDNIDGQRQHYRPDRDPGPRRTLARAANAADRPRPPNPTHPPLPVNAGSIARTGQPGSGVAGRGYTAGQVRDPNWRSAQLTATLYGAGVVKRLQNVADLPYRPLNHPDPTASPDTSVTVDTNFSLPAPDEATAAATSTET